jgi:hypothetical protein
MGSGDKLATVPETYGGFEGEQIDGRGGNSHEPTEKIGQQGIGISLTT